MFRSVYRAHARQQTVVLSVVSGSALLWNLWESRSTPAAVVNCEAVPDVPPPPAAETDPAEGAANTTTPHDDEKAFTAQRAASRLFHWGRSPDDHPQHTSVTRSAQVAAARAAAAQEAAGDESRPPCPAWNYNWDNMQTDATSPETMATTRGFHESRMIGNVRHILLVRHGQYREDFKDDKRRILTPLGRHQAELTGQRLALMARGGLGMMNPEFSGPCSIKAIHVSDMARAKETAHIIAKHLPGVPLTTPDPMLNEALPAGMVPTRPDIDHEAALREIAANTDRIEGAYHKYFHRAEPYSDDEKVEHSHTDEDEDNPHEFEVIVCHGNVIRYMFCRALQLPPEAWLRLSTFNCSITYLMIQPNGICSCRAMGDIGHMGYDSLTFSALHGLNW